MKYIAKSASDKSDDWPLWMVWDGQLNITIKAIKSITGKDIVGMPFLPRKLCEKLAAELNQLEASGLNN